MFVLRQSATGQYVITHPPTNTVMVGDDLVATFERMQAFAEANEQTPVPATPAPRPRARRLVIAAVVVLPFLWLGALHLSLGRLVTELRAPVDESEDREELRARIERLESSLSTPEARPVKPRSKKAAAAADKPEPDADDVGDDG